jgi:hypothetical protein
MTRPNLRVDSTDLWPGVCLDLKILDKFVRIHQ